MPSPSPTQTLLASKETIEIFNEEENGGNKVELELFEGVKSRAFFDLYKRIGEIERQALIQ